MDTEEIKADLYMELLTEFGQKLVPELTDFCLRVADLGDQKCSRAATKSMGTSLGLLNQLRANYYALLLTEKEKKEKE